MQENILISVITICYNAAEELKHTLHSVASQTYPHIQYIVIDGASTDGTAALLRAYRHNIDILVSETDAGIYDAMNKGLRLATGDYLCFMNAGDTFATDDTLTQVFSLLSASLLDPLPDIIYGETVLVNSQRKYLRDRRLKAPERLTYKSFLRGMLVCHQSFYPRRSLAPLYDLRYHYSSDFDWILKILKQSHNYLNTHLVLTNYLSEGATTRHHRESLIERFKIMCHHYGCVPTIIAHIYIVGRSLFLR